MLKPLGFKGTHSTELFYRVGRGEHTALVSSVRGTDNTGGTQNAVRAAIETRSASSLKPKTAEFRTAI